MPTLTGGEFAFIDWLRRRTGEHPNVLVGPGDDTAVLRPTGRELLVTTDMLMEGSCFLIDEAGPLRVGRKAMAVNLSDVAAMAGTPTAALVSLGLPREGGRRLAEQLYEGMREMADRFGVPIVGGDTNSWTGKLVISVTVLGEASDKGPVRRNGAKVGDWIMVTGPLGGSILGKHLDFTPRVHEAIAIHREADLHAMIDISDGLTADLTHILEESGRGALLRAEAIPITAEAERLAATSGKTPLEHALSDGEDFELLFTVSAAVGDLLLKRQPIVGVTLHHIGEITPDGLAIKEGGHRRKLSPAGYVHELG